MPVNYYSNKKYSFKRGGPIRLAIYWTFDVEDVLVVFDGIEIGRFQSRKAFVTGKTFTFKDGAVLEVKYGHHPITMAPLPDVKLNGKPLPDSFADPIFNSHSEIKTASYSFIFGGFLSVFGGVVFSISNPLWYTVYLLLTGITAPFVGIFIRKRSRLALKIGIVYAATGFITFLVAALYPENVVDSISSISDLLGSVMFTFGLLKGFEAMDTLDQRESHLEHDKEIINNPMKNYSEESKT